MTTPILTIIMSTFRTTPSSFTVSKDVFWFEFSVLQIFRKFVLPPITGTASLNLSLSLSRSLSFTQIMEHLSWRRCCPLVPLDEKLARFVKCNRKGVTSKQPSFCRMRKRLCSAVSPYFEVLKSISSIFGLARLKGFACFEMFLFEAPEQTRWPPRFLFLRLNSAKSSFNFFVLRSDKSNSFRDAMWRFIFGPLPKWFLLPSISASK